MARLTATARIHQHDLTVQALQAIEAAGGFLRTSSLREKLREHFRPAGEDNVPFPSQDEPKFNQIVGNLVSNRDMQRSIFSMGYAVSEHRGVRVTAKGRSFLETVLP